VGHAAASFGPEQSRPKGIKCQISSKAKAIRLVLGQLLLARRTYLAAKKGKPSSPGLPSLPGPVPESQRLTTADPNSNTLAGRGSPKWRRFWLARLREW
jgi:hypothetical protein